MMILTLNAGSSSLKAAVFDDALTKLIDAQIDAIGGDARLIAPALNLDTAVPATTHAEALTAMFAALQAHAPAVAIDRIGHRIVHGGPVFSAPMVLDDAVLATLATFIPWAPLHQPHNLAGVRAAMAAFPGALQIGCFDTAFHHGKSRVEDMFALPRRFYDAGVRRYGFHGLSYDYLASALAQVYPTAASGRTIIAHLGNGASMCALLAGRSVASTMGFSALDGLPMGTRCGAIDPGVLLWLLRDGQMSPDDLETLLYADSGLKGMSGLSNDMRTLAAAGTPEAEEAIAYFVARCRREIGGLATVLGGLDTLVFSGGIGEHAHAVRARICDGLDFLGLTLDAARNAANATRLSADGSRVLALMLPTDEEQIIARHARDLR